MIEDIFNLKEIESKYNFVTSIIDNKSLSRSLEEIDGQLSNPDTWKDNKKATTLNKTRSDITSKLESINAIKVNYSSFKECIDMAKEDSEFIDMAKEQYDTLANQLETMETKLLLNGEQDHCNAIVSINSGAGGNESEDWTSMLTRMYTMWANKNGFKTTIESFHDTSAGYSSITLNIQGPYAYGFLKNEMGVHRLIRNSPFDADFARHTSFASVEVLPDVDDTVSIEIKESDCEITAIRGSGSGGQNVNKVSSCIRLKHIPTGIQIVSRSERDQLANKKAAFSRLKAKLYEIEMNKLNKKIDEQNAAKSDVSFGHQIRSYVLDLGIVNDHRAEVKLNNPNDVLDGNINHLIKTVLKQKCQR